MTRTAESYKALVTSWSLLALSLRYPDMELTDAVEAGAWDEAAAGVAAELMERFGNRVELADADGASVAAWREASDECLGPLRREATRLFVGFPEPAVSPYEGIWRARVDGSAALLAVNPHSSAVARFCKSCGLGHPKGTNEPLDHISAECELMSYLAYRACAEALGEAAQGSMPGGSAQAAYGVFLADHAREWMPQFADALEDEARIVFYRAVARMLRSTVAAEVSG